MSDPQQFNDDMIRRSDLPAEVMGLIHDLCYHHEGRDVVNYVKRAQRILSTPSNDASAAPVNPNPSTPAAAGQEEGEWRKFWNLFHSLWGDGKEGTYLKEKWCRLQAIAKNFESHNASLREQLHGEKEPVAEHVDPPRQNELLSCPFCGKMPLQKQWEECRPWAFIECQTADCVAPKIEITKFKPRLDPLFLVGRWNKRAAPSVSDRDIAAASRVSFPDSSASLREKEEQKDDIRCSNCGVINSPYRSCFHCGKRLAAGKEAQLIRNIWTLIEGYENPHPESAAWIPRENVGNTLRTLLMTSGYVWEGDATMRLATKSEASEPNTHVLQKALELVPYARREIVNLVLDGRQPNTIALVHARLEQLVKDVLSSHAPKSEGGKTKELGEKEP